MNQSINEPTNQPTNHPSNHPINQLINQSINQSILSINQSIKQSNLIFKPDEIHGIMPITVLTLQVDCEGTTLFSNNIFSDK